MRRTLGSSADDTILTAAQAAGLDSPYSCAAGVCSTCKAKLVEGKVLMDRTWALSGREIDEGYILTCQARPLTDVVVSYDER
jgi:ring-1,2-phenylacetyl-CoA epoxidase subunit PaaE